MINPSAELHTAIAAAKAAGTIMDTFQADLSSLTITYKGRFDLLTQADVACEEAIMGVLKAAFPHDHYLGEESGGQLPESGRVWIIDPIDGTTNFSHGFPFFACSIALWEDGLPKTAVVYAPKLNELFTAEEGKGAYLNGQRLNVSREEDPGNVIIGTGFPYRDITVIADYMKLLKRFMEETQGLRRPGSASYDLACVAAGRYGGFFEYALAPWDVAAGALLITEAGGVVSDWKGGRDWLTGKRIASGNFAIHAYLLNAIQTVVRPALLHSVRK